MVRQQLRIKRDSRRKFSLDAAIAHRHDKEKRDSQLKSGSRSIYWNIPNRTMLLAAYKILRGFAEHAMLYIKIAEVTDRNPRQMLHSIP